MHVFYQLTLQKLQRPSCTKAFAFGRNVLPKSNNNVCCDSMSANIFTNAYTLSKLGFQTEMVGYSSSGARSWHISSLRVFSHVISSFFYFTNQNLVIQYGSDGKCKLSWHIFTCLVFLFAAFWFFFFFGNRAPHTGSCHAEVLYWLF